MSNIAINNQAGNEFRQLIDPLSLPELRILKDDEDLIARVKEIARLDAEQLREYMVKTWDLQVESCQNDDWWVDIEEVRKRCPEWARAEIEGHYIPGDRFVKWAQRWLMQEVRVNVDIKYIQALRELEKKKEEAARQALEDQFSSAWGWGGM